VDTWSVDIISMSCGFTKPIEKIQRAIDHAYSERVLVLAAAGNSGATGGWRWPASDPNVIGMTAAYGEGNKYGRNPTPGRDRESFSILGCAVSGYIRATESSTAKLVSRSGTSHATAVAAAIAAITMQILRDCETDIVRKFPVKEDSFKHAEGALRTKAGMSLVFRQMVGGDDKRDGYYFVRPWTIVHETGDRHRDAMHVARNIIQWCGAASFA
jgi:hypothetical protein